MSKSILTAEVEALQWNTAFISEFMDIPIFDLQTQAAAETETTAEFEVSQEDVKPAVNQEVAVVQTEVPAQKPAVVAPPTVTKIVMPKITATAVAKKNFAGKYVIWTPGKPTPDERVLIKKIIEAVGIPASSLVLENETNPELADWSSSPFVFAFGVTTVPGNLYQLSDWQGTKLLKTSSLAELSADVNQKKALWAGLKQAFKL